MKIKTEFPTDDDLIRALCPHFWDNFPDGINFWIFCHCKLLWNIINWNWFCLWCGENHYWYPKFEQCRKKIK